MIRQKIRHRPVGDLIETTDDYEGRIVLDEVQAADYLGVSPATLATWRSTGRYQLPYCKMGRLIRYRIHDLAQFLESRMR